MLVVEQLRRPFLGPVDFKLDDGECLAVTGPSGSGKTLLLRAIVDLDPNDGVVSLDGDERRSVPAPGWRSRVVMVPAESGWWSDVVGDHFFNEADAKPLIEAFGLPAEALRWQVQRLSTGERQRLALVRALMLRPDVLLLDEPTAALDRQTTRKVETMLRAQLKAGMSIVLVTHDTAQLKRLASSRISLEHGKAGPQEPVS